LVARAGPKLTPRDVPVARRRGGAIITRRDRGVDPDIANGQRHRRHGPQSRRRAR